MPVQIAGIIIGLMDEAIETGWEQHHIGIALWRVCYGVMEGLWDPWVGFGVEFLRSLLPASCGVAAGIAPCIQLEPAPVQIPTRKSAIPRELLHVACQAYCVWCPMAHPAR